MPQTKIIANMLLCCLALSSLAFAQEDISSDYTWKPVRIGGGGFTMGIVIHPTSGDRYARIDVNGLYHWNEQTGEWDQLMAYDHMPADCPMVTNVEFNGVQAVGIAPSDPNRLYCAWGTEYGGEFGALYASDDKGQHWSRISSQRDIKMGANHSYSRHQGERMAVDPVNADVCWFGSIRHGMFVTEDAGKSWREIPEDILPHGKPQPATPSTGKESYSGIGQIAFDPTSKVINGRTQRIYATIWGYGIYKSEDAGATWSLFFDERPDIMEMVVCANGTINIECGQKHAIPMFDNLKPEFAIMRYEGGTWRTLSGADWDRLSGFTVDEKNSRKMAVYKRSELLVSRDAGASWQVQTVGEHEAKDIPWLAWTMHEGNPTDHGYVSEMIFDPQVPDRLWVASGIGNWYLDLNDANPRWISNTAGIEDLVANHALKVPGGPLITCVMDRAVFVSHDDHDLDTYDDRHYVLSGFGGARCSDYSNAVPSTMAACTRGTLIVSTDNGKTWAEAPQPKPNGLRVGEISIASNDPNNWTALSEKDTILYTRDGGKSWKQGLTPKGLKGRTANFFSDKIRPNTFYYAHNKMGLLISTDGGANWTVQAPIADIPLKTVDAWAVDRSEQGLLAFSCSFQNSDDGSGLVISSDQGKSWRKVDGFTQTYTIAFGKAQKDGMPSTLYARGLYRGEIGTWRSTDLGASWVKIDTHPAGIYHKSSTMCADWDIFGRVYIGLKGNGFVYGQPSSPSQSL